MIGISIFESIPHKGVGRLSLKFLLIPGLSSDPKILDGIKSQLLDRYPGSTAKTISSTNFRSVGDGVRQLGCMMEGMDTGENDFVLVCHSAGGMIGAHFIDDSRVIAVITMCTPSHYPWDYLLKVWPVQNLYFLRCLLNRRFRLKGKHVLKLFGWNIPEEMQTTSYGWFALQVSLGVLFGNPFKKVVSKDKLLSFCCDGDPTVLPKAVARFAKRYHGKFEAIPCGHHYPMLERTTSMPIMMMLIHQFLKGRTWKIKD